ncbi:MAG: thioesterase family protein [Alphaproteobacteria bacterium]|nr:thioesterase family protein [Alphaproteobacteria bacterium]
MHALDAATQLTRIGPERLSGRTSPHYANLGGPFGGWTAATMLRGVLDDERRHGAPVALTVNYCAAIADGGFEISCRERRTGKSTQHWSLEMMQGDRVTATASVVCGPRRPVWSHRPAHPPAIAAPETLPLFSAGGRSVWVEQYEFRFEKGAIDFGSRGAKELRAPDSLLWMRDRPERPLDFLSLAALSDAFFIRAFVVRDQLVPVGTITLTTYFHTDEDGLAAQGSDYVLGYATAHTFSGGFADQSAQLWGRNGLLATSTQVVWYRE